MLWWIKSEPVNVSDDLCPLSSKSEQHRHKQLIPNSFAFVVVVVGIIYTEAEEKIKADIPLKPSRCCIVNYIKHTFIY